METKICSKCGVEKPISEFNKRSRSLDGLRSDCCDCRKKVAKEYRNNNSDKIKENQKNWVNKNIDVTKEKHRNLSNLYRKNNPNKVKEIYKKWRLNNPDYDKNWRNANPEKVSWRRILHNSLNRLGKTKEGHTIDLLGYSAIELKEHLESLFTDGMSWENHGEWHIDHIKRVCEFDKETPMNVVNALSNLRPLWAITREINGIVYEGNLNRG